MKAQSNTKTKADPRKPQPHWSIHTLQNCNIHFVKTAGVRNPSSKSSRPLSCTFHVLKGMDRGLSNAFDKYGRVLCSKLHVLRGIDRGYQVLLTNPEGFCIAHFSHGQGAIQCFWQTQKKTTRVSLQWPLRVLWSIPLRLRPESWNPELKSRNTTNAGKGAEEYQSSKTVSSTSTFNISRCN